MASPRKISAPINYLFYCNKVALDSQLIETVDYIHKHWFGNYDVLETRHDYIQWLFPTLVASKHSSTSSPLQVQEAHLMCADEAILSKIITSYRLMLDFYGLQMVDDDTGDLARAPHYAERYANLEAHPHNRLRITRILISLGQLGLVAYKHKLLQFLTNEILGLPSFQPVVSPTTGNNTATTAFKVTFSNPQAGTLLIGCKASLKSFWMPACCPEHTQYTQLTGEAPGVILPKVLFTLPTSSSSSSSAKRK